jgi:hypothetical protein
MYVTNRAQSKVVGALRAPTNNFSKISISKKFEIEIEIEIEFEF